MGFFNTAAGRFVLLGIGVLVISTAAPVIKFLPHVPSLVIAASRLALATCILVPMGYLQRQTSPHTLTTRDISIVIAAGVCLALHFATWIASLRYTSVASSVVLVTLNPLLLALASYVLWGERLARSLAMGIGLGMLGSVCIAWNDFRGLSVYTNDQALFGDFLALCGAVSMSAYLLCGRLVRTHISLSLYVGAVYACAATLLVTVCLLRGLPFSGYSGHTYLLLALLGLGPQLIGHTTLNWALAYVSPTVVGLALLGEPVGASILAWLFLEEAVSWLQVIGGLLILSGIILGRSQEPDKEAGFS